MTTTSACGAYLDRCRCRNHPITPRSSQEMQDRHQAAVARARRSGWASWIAPKDRELPALRIVGDATGRGWVA